jgi:hypothetical protein
MHYSILDCLLIRIKICDFLNFSFDLRHDFIIKFELEKFTSSYKIRTAKIMTGNKILYSYVYFRREIKWRMSHSIVAFLRIGGVFNFLVYTYKYEYRLYMCLYIHSMGAARSYTCLHMRWQSSMQCYDDLSDCG